MNKFIRFPKLSKAPLTPPYRAIDVHCTRARPTYSDFTLRVSRVRPRGSELQKGQEDPCSLNQESFDSDLIVLSLS